MKSSWIRGQLRVRHAMAGYDFIQQLLEAGALASDISVMTLNNVVAQFGQRSFVPGPGVFGIAVFLLAQ